MTLFVEARAKINWTLDVTGRRPDGYHELDMLMQSVTLSDRLTFREADALTLRVLGAPGVPADGRNLVLRAARALREAAGCARGAEILLEKRIPSEAGMGGGSSDAAAALTALNLLWGTGFSPGELERIGLSVGADVPFCVRGGFQRVSGIGEALSPLPAREDVELLVVKPEGGLSTREVFARHQADPTARRPDREGVLRALERLDFPALRGAMANALQPAAERMNPEVAEAAAALLAAGAAAAQMTGSGSAVFGVFPDPESCRDAQRRLLGRWPVCERMRTAGCGCVVRKAEGARPEEAEPWEN